MHILVPGIRIITGDCLGLCVHVFIVYIHYYFLSSQTLCLVQGNPHLPRPCIIIISIARASLYHYSIVVIVSA